MAEPPPNPVPAPPDPEEARAIPDHLMVFHSSETQTPKIPAKEVKMQNKKNRIKARKSTPAPLTKGHGRKRFVPSPLPEDKQLKKKLDFGGEENVELETSGACATLESPKCKVTLFSSCPNDTKGTQGPGAMSKDAADDEEAQMELVVHENARPPPSRHPPTLVPPWMRRPLEVMKTGP